MPAMVDEQSGAERAVDRRRLAASAALQAVIAGILFSTGGAAVKATDLDAWQVAGSRSLVAVALLLAAVPAARKWAGTASAPGFVRRKAWWRDPARRRALLLTLGIGCCYCLTLVLFVHANKRTTAAETIFLQSTAPVFVLLFSPLLLRERVGARQLLFVPLFGVGLLLAFFGGADAGATAPDPRTGNLLATGSGLAYGLTLLGLRAASRVGRSRGGAAAPGLAAVACGNVFVCLVCLPVAAPPLRAGLQDLGIVVFLGLFQVALGYVFVTRAARELEAPQLALLLLLEPALSPFWAMWLHAEEPHLLTWFGGAAIVLATALLATLGERRKE